MIAFRLRSLHWLARLGLTGALVALAMGLVASSLHLVNHYEKRDGLPGLTVDDITAAYHGIDAPAPLVTALRRDHPEGLPPDARESLLNWLQSDRVSEDYDSLDLGDSAPAEIIATSCLACHAREPSPPAGQLAAKDLPLEYWDDVRKVAFARQIPPTPREIILVSMHAHAPTMAIMTIVVGAFSLATVFPRTLTGALIGAAGLALAADFASWILASDFPRAVFAIIGAGVVYHVAVALLLVLTLVELWRPRRACDAPRPGA